MSRDFDEDLKGALRESARRAPIVPDLSDAAIRQARGIRRRRRVTGAVAAAAVVAIAVPVGLQAGDALSNGRTPLPPATQGPDNGPDDGDGKGDDAGDLRSSLVTVQLSQLPTGDAPDLPYLDGSQLMVAGVPIDLGVDPASISQVTYAGGTAYYTTNDEGELTLRSAPEEMDEVAITSGPWASPDGRYVAYSADGELSVIDTDNDEVSSVQVGGDYLRSVSFARDEVYVVAGNDDTLLRWTIGDSQVAPVPGIVRATAVSPDDELVADMHQVDDLEASSCTQVKALSDGGVVWDTCEHRILRFSPFSGLVLGANEYADGAGDPYVVVLDDDGKLVLKAEGPNDRNTPTFFQGAVFESETTVLTPVAQGDSAALVRCDLTTGECELATRVVEGVDPFDGQLPFQLLS